MESLRAVFHVVLRYSWNALPVRTHNSSNNITTNGNDTNDYRLDYCANEFALQEVYDVSNCKLEANKNPYVQFLKYNFA